MSETPAGEARPLGSDAAGSGGITTHVLDTAHGAPAAGVRVALARHVPDPPDVDAGVWDAVGTGVTDADGRCRALLPPGTPLTEGVWRLTFDTAGYFDAAGVTGFYPRVAISFEVTDAGQHYHVPLLLSPYGYATYRGS
jgi:5-hydroxyisourate hydrolase